MSVPSSELDPLTHPLPRKRVWSPPLEPKGEEQHSLAGEGGPDSDDCKESLVSVAVYTLLLNSLISRLEAEHRPLKAKVLQGDVFEKVMLKIKECLSWKGKRFNAQKFFRISLL